MPWRPSPLLSIFVSLEKLSSSSRAKAWPTTPLPSSPFVSRLARPAHSELAHADASAPRLGNCRFHPQRHSFHVDRPATAGSCPRDSLTVRSSSHQIGLSRPFCRRPGSICLDVRLRLLASFV